MLEEKSTTYNLFTTERKYRQDTLVSYYFQKNKKVIKNCSPIDIDGERYRLNHESGEITTYSKKDIFHSYGVSLRRTKIMMDMLLTMNDFDWFWTLTFDKEKVDRTNDKVVFDCYKKYINNIKKQYPSFKYMCFPERHEDGCFHFHLLTAGLTPKQMGLVDSGKVCCSWAEKRYNGIRSREYFNRTKHDHEHEMKETDGETIYNASNFIYGYTTVSRIVSRERCNSYVKKYVEKALGSTEIFKKRFYYSSNLNVPSIVKRLIGADFEHPYDIDKVKNITDNPIVLNAKSTPHINYNVLQVKIDNDIKQNIDNGLIPLSQKEIEELGEIYGLF